MLFMYTPILGPLYSDIEETISWGVAQVRVRGSIARLFYGEMAPYLTVIGIILVLFDLSLPYVCKKDMN